MNVDIPELGHNKVQDVGLAHLFKLGYELNEIEDGAEVSREPFDLADEVLLDVVRRV
jgi:hypothetical protein